jgi:hypothetical protein
MDVGVHSSASSATKADAVPMFARAVSSCGTGWPPPRVMQSPGPEDVPFKYRGWAVDFDGGPDGARFD